MAQQILAVGVVVLKLMELQLYLVAPAVLA
jgi:hypothetical protein